ncbi:ribonuclease E inhibitor RraB [Massilia arenosa]|uniref:Ribonuclease E inhibitor RraB n=1 Tax=Zemynaea arenosa TaxID=2561931 RepID=A0A4Y9S2Y7_9BURK|nr:ribonuclease E inhibitor RraB [Massilia arenosa]TFW15726.1 ribonuclease E inhibitor RraB [Massilia arenosa]
MSSDVPDDANGDVLREMAAQGDDLTVAREIDFSVILPSEEQALAFAMHLLKNGQKVSFAPTEGSDELPFQVQAHPVMLPTHDNITDYEALLEQEAAPFGGRNDGWGCMAQ